MKIKLLCLIATLDLYSCGSSTRHSGIDISSLKEAWDAENDPKLLKDHYEVRFTKLPLAAELERKPWTDTYWPSNQGGIANRWNDPSRPNSFSYPLAKRPDLATMTLKEMQKLSPAEKYDIYMDRLDYPLVRSERSRTSPENPSWFGLCHGWAPASLNFDEPHPIKVQSRSGITVSFGSSDIKALLTFSQQYGQNSRMVGNRCGRESSPNAPYSNDPACRDINAGSFHIIVANQIGIQKMGFVADVARNAEVWNQPVFGFNSSKVSETNRPNRNAAPGTVKIITIETRMFYIAELGANWDARPFETYPSQASVKAFSYNLELNRQGEIIGGEWLSDERPDFVWTQGKPRFTGYLKDVEHLYQQSIR